MTRQLLLVLAAVQYLTRVPMPRRWPLPADALAASARYFPLAGALVAAGAVGLHAVVWPHAGREIAAVFVLIYLVATTGAIHEDALADAADGLGGGWTKAQALAIMRDSRVGSFGALAVTFSVLVRFVCLRQIPAAGFGAAMVAAQVLSRWTPLVLGWWLPPAREQEGQGARLARRISGASLAAGTALAAGIVGLTAWRVLIPMLVVAAGLALATGWYYRRRIGGVTGDCFGATMQLTETAIYLIAAWPGLVAG